MLSKNLEQDLRLGESLLFLRYHVRYGCHEEGLVEWGIVVLRKGRPLRIIRNPRSAFCIVLLKQIRFVRQYDTLNVLERDVIIAPSSQKTDRLQGLNALGQSRSHCL